MPAAIDTTFPSNNMSGVAKITDEKVRDDSFPKFLFNKNKDNNLDQTTDFINSGLMIPLANNILPIQQEVKIFAGDGDLTEFKSSALPDNNLLNINTQTKFESGIDLSSISDLNNLSGIDAAKLINHINATTIHDSEANTNIVNSELNTSNSEVKQDNTHYTVSLSNNMFQPAQVNMVLVNNAQQSPEATMLAQEEQTSEDLAQKSSSTLEDIQSEQNLSEAMEAFSFSQGDANSLGGKENNNFLVSSNIEELSKKDEAQIRTDFEISTNQQNSQAASYSSVPEAKLEAEVIKAGELLANRHANIDDIKLTIQKAINSNEHRINLQLQPAELGNLEIIIDISNSGKNVILFLADNQAALELLQKDAKILERNLAEIGIKTENSELNFGLNNGQQNGNQERNFANEKFFLTAKTYHLNNQQQDDLDKILKPVSNDKLDIKV